MHLKDQNRLVNVLKSGGDYKRSGYVQYVAVILADVPARTTFIDIYKHIIIALGCSEVCSEVRACT